MEMVVRRWQLGWGLCRGLPPATDVPDALLATVGLPGRQLELFALHADDDAESIRRLAKWAAEAAEPTWVMIPTNSPDAADAALQGAGLELFPDREWLMTIALAAHPDRTPPAPYVVTASFDGPVVTTRVTTPSGELAASGNCAVVGTDAVMHEIQTSPEHRRKGLGSVVMASLSRNALDRGATTGLLVASRDGERLYTSLGWSTALAAVSARPPVRSQD